MKLNASEDFLFCGYCGTTHFMDSGTCNHRRLPVWFA